MILTEVPKSDGFELVKTIADSLISRVDAEIGFDNRRLEYRLESIKKSRMLLDRLHDAMTVLKQRPKSGATAYTKRVGTAIPSHYFTQRASAVMAYERY